MEYEYRPCRFFSVRAVVLFHVERWGFKFGFVGMFDWMLLSTPHPPPAAGAGRHLPPKGKAFRGDP
ncbi:MAG: hypothetical protein IJ363_08040, partial [Clostridia bacterium]|nr:hypothetical protein [Clostridia bacterium]